MSNFEGLIFAFFARPIVGGRNIAVTVVLFMKPEIPATTDMRRRSRRLALVPASWSNRAPMTSSTPVSCKAALITKIEPRMMMISELKPSNASAGVRMRQSTRTISTPRVTISTETFSEAKMTIAIKSRPRTMAIEMVMADVRFTRECRLRQAHTHSGVRPISCVEKVRELVRQRWRRSCRVSARRRRCLDRRRVLSAAPGL